MSFDLGAFVQGLTIGGTIGTVWWIYYIFKRLPQAEKNIEDRMVLRIPEIIQKSKPIISKAIKEETPAIMAVIKAEIPDIKEEIIPLIKAEIPDFKTELIPMIKAELPDLKEEFKPEIEKMIKDFEEKITDKARELTPELIDEGFTKLLEKIVDPKDPDIQPMINVLAIRCYAAINENPELKAKLVGWINKQAETFFKSQETRIANKYGFGDTEGKDGEAEIAGMDKGFTKKILNVAKAAKAMKEAFNAE